MVCTLYAAEGIVLASLCQVFIAISVSNTSLLVHILSSRVWNSRVSLHPVTAGVFTLEESETLVPSHILLL